MKVRYNDPYGSPFELIIPDGEPEAIKEIIEYLNENARLIRNAERREAYHTLYHLEALDYEGNSIAYLDTPSTSSSKRRKPSISETHSHY